jgi:hypothetical protein
MTTTAVEEPEIFATGLGNPRGCNFDSARASYLFSASVDEVVNMKITSISMMRSVFSFVVHMESKSLTSIFIIICT